MHRTTTRSAAHYERRSRQNSLSPYLLEETGLSRADIRQARDFESAVPVAG